MKPKSAPDKMQYLLADMSLSSLGKSRSGRGTSPLFATQLEAPHNNVRQERKQKEHQ